MWIRESIAAQWHRNICRQKTMRCVRHEVKEINTNFFIRNLEELNHWRRQSHVFSYVEEGVVAYRLQE